MNAFQMQTQDYKGEKVASENRERKLQGREKSRRYGGASRAFVEDMQRSRSKRDQIAIERSESRRAKQKVQEFLEESE